MIINVTQKLISVGEKQSMSYCPVAKAFHNAGFPLAEVGPDCVWINPESMSKDLPAIAAEFIESFDRGNPVFPFSFEFDA